MPIYMEISRLYRLVTIVARGTIGPEEMRGAAQQLFDARVPEFAKLVDLTAANGEFTRQQVENIAALLRGGPEARRGPVAFLVDPARGEFARAFKVTQGDRPVSLFRDLREARDWLASIDQEERQATLAPYQEAGGTPWTDPQREAVLFRGERRRDVAIKSAA